MGVSGRSCAYSSGGWNGHLRCHGKGVSSGSALVMAVPFSSAALDRASTALRWPGCPLDRFRGDFEAWYVTCPRMNVTEFEVTVSESSVDDLRTRLSLTRWPDAETVADWSQGAPLSFVRSLAEHWEHKYDWRAVE